MKVMKYYCIFLILSTISCSIGHGLGPEPLEKPGISGTVTFVGNWPQSTSEVRVAVYEEYPPSSFLTISAFSNALPMNVDNADYFIPLNPGVYGWIIVAWRSETQFWSPDNVLGYYKENPESTVPKAVIVREKTSTKNVDITADFNNLKNAQ